MLQFPPTLLCSTLHTSLVLLTTSLVYTADKHYTPKAYTSAHSPPRRTQQANCSPSRLACNLSQSLLHQPMPVLLSNCNPLILDKQQLTIQNTLQRIPTSLAIIRAGLGILDQDGRAAVRGGLLVASVGLSVVAAAVVLARVDHGVCCREAAAGFDADEDCGAVAGCGV
jgi:hypothetical protein